MNLFPLAAVILAAHQSPAPEPPRPAMYAVHVLPAATRRIAVRATLPGGGAELRMATSRPGDVPELANAGWPALVRQLTVTDAAGHRVATTGNGAAGWKLARTVQGPLTLAYEVDYAPLAARGWPAPREAAFADARHLIVIGRSLFITTPAQRASVVRVTSPRGWQAVAPWPSTVGARRSFSVATTGDLTENLVAFERGAPDVLTAGGFHLKVVSFGGWQGARAEVREVLGAALRRLVAFIGVAGEADYLVVLLPEGERGGESFRASFAFTFDSTPSRANRGEWANTIAHEVFHYWNGWRLSGADYQSSQWFQEGFTEYAANLALVSAGLITADEFYGKLATHVSDYRRLTTPLDAPGGHKGPPLYGGGALVAFIWDVRIREATDGKRGVGDVLHELLVRTDDGTRPYTWADIEAALEKVAPDDWAAFEHRYIHGTEPLPLDDALARVGLRLSQGADSAARIAPDPAASGRGAALRRALIGEPR